MRTVTRRRSRAGPLWTKDLSANTRRVAEVLRVHGPRTRSDLSALTGLSRPTISASLADLASAGLIEGGAVAVRPAGGRPASIVRLARSAGLAVGVDIGRRHIRAAAADLGHAVLADIGDGLDFEAENHPIKVLDRAVMLVDDLLAQVGADRSAVVGVGLGIPAPITSSGRIGAPALLPGWADVVPAVELGQRLELAVRADNDANLGALGEYLWGAGRGCADLVYVKLATGVGAGIVLDGRLYRGAAGTAGELGHVTLDARGPVCRCGNRGCLELSVGGRALLSHARAAHPDLSDLGALVRLADGGDAGCRRLLTDAGTQLGFAMGSLVNLINPGRIVLGGALGAAAGLLLEPVRRGLADTAMPAAASAVQILPAELGERDCLLGSVALALGADAATPATGHLR
jgi:predicted NBD/HSP70 family sugar kinase